MGGGGTFYDRDIADGYKTNSSGVSKQAEEKLSRSRLDSALLPKNRTIRSKARSPVIYTFDVTASMGTLPQVIYDKMPLIAGQIVENRYLDDPEVSLAAIGDVKCDQAPIQIGDFSPMRKLDDWLQRLWLEGGGGGNGGESYEFTAYYYARYCEIPNAVTPFLLMTGDEPIRETLYKSELEKHFGGKHETVETKDVFDELKKKFKGNVFLIYASHGDGSSDRVIEQWQRMIGKERVIVLGADKAVADVTLGIFAVMTGSRTLDEYCEDMKTKRDKAQSKSRIEEVRKTLQQLTALAPSKQVVRAQSGKKSRTVRAEASEEGASTPTAGRKKNKPGRI